MRAEQAVNKRIENAMAEHRAAARQQRTTFLENATRDRTAAQLPEADREKLREAYRRAADRRAPEQDRRRNRGRDDR